MQFPHIIHQIWLQGTKLIPEKFHKNIESIKKLHPDWTYIIWDEKMIINTIQRNKIWLKTYYEFEYLHQKVDYARYIILYLYGGAYLDIDVYSVKPLDQLVNQYANYDIILSYIGVGHFDSYVSCQREKCINNGIIIAKPYTNILKKIIDHINKHHSCSILTPKLICIMTTCGPTTFSQLILDNIDISKIKILKNDYLEPCVYSKCNITQNTYTVHQHEGSWYSNSIKQLGIMYIHYKNIICLSLLIILFISLFFYNKKV